MTSAADTIAFVDVIVMPCVCVTVRTVPVGVEDDRKNVSLTSTVPVAVLGATEYFTVVMLITIFAVAFVKWTVVVKVTVSTLGAKKPVQPLLPASASVTLIFVATTVVPVTDVTATFGRPSKAIAFVPAHVTAGLPPWGKTVIFTCPVASTPRAVGCVAAAPEVSVRVQLPAGAPTWPRPAGGTGRFVSFLSSTLAGAVGAATP